MQAERDYAIVSTGGFQFRVEGDRRIRVPKMTADEGQKVVLDQVLLVSNKKGRWVGKPVVKGAKVITNVLGHGRDTKIRGSKFKRRTKYRRSWGHRQGYTELLVQEIKSPTRGGA
jgi:large subunit ribosomal protein L21